MSAVTGRHRAPQPEQRTEGFTAYVVAAFLTGLALGLTTAAALTIGLWQ